MSQKSRNAYLLRTYGITEKQYNDLLKKQGRACAVCRNPVLEGDRNLAVDHNHKTGEIRGLLCFRCNHTVVGRHTDADLLESAANYLRQGTGWFVPKKKKRRRKKRR